MEINVRIVSAERIGDGVMVEFSDGLVALFPAAVLWELVPGFKIETLLEDE